MKMTSFKPIIMFASMVLFFLTACKKNDDDNSEKQSVPTLSTIEISDITQTTAVSGGNILDDGGSTVIERGVCWSLGHSPTINDSKTSDGAGAGSFTSEIQGLEPATTYSLRAFATNGQGTAYGNTLTFTTNEADLFMCGNAFFDTRDGQSYATVQIGDQCWMAENLAYLAEVSPSLQKSETEPYYYVFDFQETDVNAAKATANYQNYGVLYNWPASLSACPPGWHLPSDAEWTQLTSYLIDNYLEFTIDNVADILKSCRQVNSPLGGVCNTEVHPRWDYNPFSYGSDDFGFSALPGGHCVNASFELLGTYGRWWSATDSSAYAYTRRMIFQGNVRRHYNSMDDGFSVRCVKD